MQRCESIMHTLFFFQGMTNYVRITLSVGDTTQADFKSVLSKTLVTVSTKFGVVLMNQVILKETGKMNSSLERTEMGKVG